MDDAGKEDGNIFVYFIYMICSTLVRLLGYFKPLSQEAYAYFDDTGYEAVVDATTVVV